MGPTARPILPQRARLDQDGPPCDTSRVPASGFGRGPGHTDSHCWWMKGSGQGGAPQGAPLREEERKGRGAFDQAEPVEDPLSREGQPGSPETGLFGARLWKGELSKKAPSAIRDNISSLPSTLREALPMPSAKPQIPSHGSKITQENGKLKVPDHPILPFIEGDGTGRDIWRASVGVFDAAVDEGLRGQAQDRLGGGLRRREGVQAVRQLAPRRDRRGLPRLSRRHQGAPDDPGGRRHPLAQRGAKAAPRPLRLPAPGPLVQGRPFAGEAAGQGGHGDLPREHGGHLRRHRMGGGERGREEGALVPGAGVPQGVQEGAVPRIRAAWA